MDRAVRGYLNSFVQKLVETEAAMHIRLAAMMVCACLALTGCAEYSKPRPKRTLAHQAAVSESKKPVPVTTQSITPLAAPTPELDPIPEADPILALDPLQVLEMSVEEQLKSAWKHICGLRNVEHVEKGRVNETEVQKHVIDEKCADVRRDSHVQ
jgi:hypothetical protein